MKNILKIYKLMLRHWGFLIFGLIFMFGYAFFSGVSIMMAVPLLDYVFKADKTQIIYSNLSEFYGAIRDVFTNFFADHNFFSLFKEKFYKDILLELKEVFIKTDPIFLLWWISITVLILIILKNIFFYGNKIMFHNLRGKTIKDIRNKIFKKYLYQSLAFFNFNKVGDSLVRMISDVDIVGRLFIASLFKTIRDVMLILVYARIALFLNPHLFFISLIVLPIFSLIINYIGKKIKKYSKRIQQESSNLFSNIEETLNSIKIVKSFSKERFEFARFKSINQKYFRYWRKSRIYNAFNVPLSEFNGTIAGVVVLLIGGRQVIEGSGDFTLGSFMAFLFAIFSILHPLKNITKTYAQIRKALVSLDRIYEILGKGDEIVEPQKPKMKKHFKKNIVYENVSFSYDNSEQVLKDINLKIKKGENIALVGKSGAGKSTLVNLLMRMYDCDEGTIYIDNTDIKDLKLKNLRSFFGIVTQESILFNASIAENISYGSLNKVSMKKIKKAAKIAYADEFIEKFPEKYMHKLNPKAANISGGQKQRMCIARAIVADPPILIFDEATSALDSEAEMKVQKAIEQATKDRTVIVIAHRLSTVLNSDKIVVLEDGKIIGFDKHEKLLETCSQYKKIYDLQFKIEDK